MKRKILALLIVLLSVVNINGCGHSTKVTQSTVNLPEYATSGNYFLYETKDRMKYLSFLENMDYDKYEIIDISIGYYGTGFDGDYVNHYAVTYKLIENNDNKVN